MSDSNSEWISISDMMTGLMMVFLFVSVVFIQQIEAEKKSIESIAQTHEDYREKLYRALVEEFREDLTTWNAEILDDSTIRFNEPDVFFDKGQSDIKRRFAVILLDFFPRYVKVIHGDEFRELIEEVRIAGHTSSDWKNTKSLRERYLNNALLSQQRSFSILEFCFSLPAIKNQREWLTTVIRANGLAFAQPITLPSGEEDKARSRRVEFKVRTRAEERIRDILQHAKRVEQAA